MARIPYPKAKKVHSQGRVAQVCLFSGLFLAYCVAHATAIPPLDLDSFVRTADLVVVGHATTIRQSGTTTVTWNGVPLAAEVMVANIEVEGILKGETASDIKVTFVAPRQPIGYKAIPLAARKIFILRRDPDGAIEPVSPYYSSLPSGPFHPQTGTLIENVISQIAGSLYPPYVDSSSRGAALWLLRSINSPITLRAFQQATHDPDPTVRLNAVADLIRYGDLSSLETAKNVLLNPSSVHISPGWRLDEVEQNLSSAIAGIRNENAIPALTEILKSGGVRDRRAAAAALRNTQSEKALPALSTALRDQDFQVRYWAVVGLAEITHQEEWQPTEDQFRQDEQKYLRHWAQNAN